MKKIIPVILILCLAVSLFGCTSKNLGKQTTVVGDGDSSYIVYNEVTHFDYDDFKDAYSDITSGVQLAGFSNTETKACKTKDTAIELAKNEINSSFDSVKLYYDETQGIWQVDFIVSADEKNSTPEKRTIVCLDENGKTSMVILPVASAETTTSSSSTEK